MTILIDRIPAFSTNYLFLLYDPAAGTAAIVDPGDGAAVEARLKTLGLTLTAIFNTHHHRDHVGGNASLLRRYPEAIVYGGEGDRGRIPGQTVFLKDGDRVAFGGQEAQVFFLPGHTRAHIAYYFPPSSDPHSSSDTLGESGDLFCGDTLFGGGCGRLFEGTPAELMTSLHRLRQLPPQTRIWCAHEYTLDNLRFALTIEPENDRLVQRFQTVQGQRQRQEATIPSVLEIEIATNPFLRCDRPSIQQAMGSTDPVKVFTRLRGKKDLF